MTVKALKDQSVVLEAIYSIFRICKAFKMGTYTVHMPKCVLKPMLVCMLLLAGHRHTHCVVIGLLSMRVMAIKDKWAVLSAVCSIIRKVV